jgi:hypothetical protein
MSLVADAVVYVLILLGVLAVVAGIMYTVGHMRHPSPKDTGSTLGSRDAVGQGPATQRTA